MVNPINYLVSFINEIYPIELYPKILEVASGSGNLSIKLSQCGYNVTAMDPVTAKKILPKGIDVKDEMFDEYTSISDFDVGIAVFPCNTSEKFVKNFVLHEKSFLLLPCIPNSCSNSMEFSEYSNIEEWISYLMGFHSDIRRKDLFDGDEILTRGLDSFKNVLYLKK